MPRTEPPPAAPEPVVRAQAGRLAGWLERLAARLEAMPAWWCRPDRRTTEGSPLDARAAAGALRRARTGPPATDAEFAHASDAAQELLRALERTAAATGATPPVRAVEPGVWTPPEPYPTLPPPGRDEVPLDAPGVPPDDGPALPPVPDEKGDREDDGRTPDADPGPERRQDPTGAGTV